MDKQATTLETPRALPDSLSGRPRFLAPLDIGGAVIVVLLDERTAYVCTPGPSDSTDLRAAGVDPETLGAPVANRVTYENVWGHFRREEGACRFGSWAVYQDGHYRPRLEVSRGIGRDATPAGREAVGESIVRALLDVSRAHPEALERARVADMRAELERQRERAIKAATELGAALAECERIGGEQGRRLVHEEAMRLLQPEARQ